MSEIFNSRERAVHEHAFKQEISGRIRGMLDAGISTKDVAGILGAEAFLDEGEKGSIIFNVADFVESEITSGMTLKLPRSVEKKTYILLPPGEGEIKTGTGVGVEQKRFIPRTRFLIDMLSELGVEYDIIEGTNTQEMMREMSFVAFLIPALRKAAVVNNEEGNATFVLHEVNPDEVEGFLKKTKDELRQLQNSGRVTVLRYPGEPDMWKAAIRDALLIQGLDMREKVARPSVSVEAASEKEPPPPGWMTPTALEKIIECTRTHISKLAEPYRGDHPEWFKTFWTGRGQGRYEHLHPKLIEIITQTVEKREMPPDGWMTKTRIAKLFSSSDQRVEKIAEKYRKEHPEWFQEYTGRSGRARIEMKYFHPELTAIIGNEISGGSPPEGWMTMAALERKVARGESVVARVIDHYRDSHPEWLHQYKVPGAGGRVTEHYHPDLVRIIEQQVERLDTVPEGWMSMTSLSQELGAMPTVFRPVIDSYRGAHPEWFQFFTTGKGRYEYLHPGLVLIVNEFVAQREQAPEGWRTKTNIARQYSCSESRIATMAEEHREYHPDWFHKYATTTGGSPQVTEHYHPDLVSIMEKELEAEEYAPDGWKTTAALFGELACSSATVREIAARYMHTHPDYFKQYKIRGRGGRMRLHYHPELVDIITNDVRSHEYAPTGWRTVTSLALEYVPSGNISVVNRIIDPYRASHRVWFEHYRQAGRGGQIREHLHPDLVMRVENELRKKYRS